MPKALARQLAELESVGTAELRVRWERSYRHPAPKRASRDLLLRAVAYHIQERAEGGLRKAALKRLARPADPKGNDSRPPRPPPPRLRPGTRLIREWRVGPKVSALYWKEFSIALELMVAAPVSGCPGAFWTPVVGERLIAA